MKKPLKAPVAAPIPTPARHHKRIEVGASCMFEARTMLTSEMTAPADRSKPPERITSVSPMAAIASVAAPLERKLISK